MTKDSAPHGTAATADPGSSQKPSGWLTRQLCDFYAYVDVLRSNPLTGTTLAIGVFVLGLVGSEVIDRLKAHYLPPDEFLAQMSEDQKQQFEDLKKNLGDIQSSIKSEDRAAFSGVKGAVDAIEKTNTDLIQQLVLAKQENETLRKVAQQKTGISGGYDFILSKGMGMRLDPQTALGVQRIYGDHVSVSLTSRSGTSADQTLQSGQSVAYQNDKAQSCKVALLSVNDAGAGSASFALSCR